MYTWDQLAHAGNTANTHVGSVHSVYIKTLTFNTFSSIIMAKHVTASDSSVSSCKTSHPV